MHLRICFRYVCHASVSEKNFPDGTQAVSSNQALPRHTQVLTYCCFLPDLTRFISSRCAGPSRQHHLPGADPTKPTLEQASTLL